MKVADVLIKLCEINHMQSIFLKTKTILKIEVQRLF